MWRSPVRKRSARARSLAATLVALLALPGCDSGVTAPEGGAVGIVVFAGDEQEGLPGQPLRWQLAVRAVDAAGEPAPGASVRFTPGARSGSVDNPRSVTSAAGIAVSAWTLGDSEVAGQTVRAELVDDAGRPIGEPVVFRARPLPPERSDLFLAANAPEGPVRFVAYRRGGYDPGQAFQRTFADSLPILPFLETSDYDEVFAVAPGRAGILAVPDWSEGRDTVRLAFAEPRRIDITVWVVKGPYEERAQTIGEHLRAAEVVWDREGLGLRFGEAEIVDATEHPRASEFHGVALEPCGIAVQSAIGERKGRINVYYVGGIAGYAAYACNSRFIVMAENSGSYPNLLAHEIGHTFGLGHESFGTDNLMNPNPGSNLTDGQVYHALFGEGSSLNTVYGHRRPAETRRCGSSVIDGVFRPDGECLPILFELDR